MVCWVTVVVVLLAFPLQGGEKDPRLLEAVRKEKKVSKPDQLDEEGFGEVPRNLNLVPISGEPSYIVGGGLASPNEYPWMAALVRPGVTASSSNFCGGSVVHPWWVITAAHCVINERPEDLEVVIGTNDLTNLTAAERIGVAEVIVHPDYNEITVDSDLAMLRLESPTSAEPLALIDHGALDDPGVMATVTGWGRTSTIGFPSPQLREVDLPIVALATANALPAFDGGLTVNMLPAGFVEGGKDSCFGDSGGPLTVPSPVGEGTMLAGLVSFGKGGCAEANSYGIYTRVSSFRNYVLGHIWPNYATFELSNGVVGELRDYDGDGLTYWDDFALPGGQTRANRQGGVASFSFLRPSGAGEVDYRVERNADLVGTWSAIDVETNLAGVNEVGDGTAWWTVNSPSSPAAADFFRLVTGNAPTFVTGPRRLEVPGSAQGALDGNDLEHPTLVGHRMKLYCLDAVASGTSLAATLRSVDFDARLELLDSAGTVVQVANTDSGQGRLGKDEKVIFTTSGTESYFLRVTTEGAGELGPYQLAVWKPSELTAMSVLGIEAAGQVSGSLSGSDDLEPLFEPGAGFYHDPYLLDLTGWTPGDMVELAMDSSSPFNIDDFIILFNAETGAFIQLADDRVFPGLPQTANDNTFLYFLPDPGVEYAVHATSAVPLDTGNYVLKADADPFRIIDIDLNQSGDSSLSVSDRVNRYGSYMEEFLLAAGTTGQVIRVSMSSDSVDSYLQIFDASTGSELAADDDSGGGLDSRLDFELKQGGRYVIRASTALANQQGSFSLSTQILP